MLQKKPIILRSLLIVATPCPEFKDQFLQSFPPFRMTHTHAHTHTHTHTQEATFVKINFVQIEIDYRPEFKDQFSQFVPTGMPCGNYRSLYSVQKAVYSIKKALDSINRALYSVKRALHSIKRALSSIKRALHSNTSCPLACPVAIPGMR